MEHEFKDCYDILFKDSVQYYDKYKKVKQDSFDFCNQKEKENRMKDRKKQEALISSDQSIELSELSEDEEEPNKEEDDNINLGTVKYDVKVYTQEELE